jgi:hypothetical protein
VSTEVALPAEQVERLIDEIIRRDSWSECLNRFALLYGPPSGKYEKNVELVRELKAQTPLMFLIPQVGMGQQPSCSRLDW